MLNSPPRCSNLIAAALLMPALSGAAAPTDSDGTILEEVVVTATLRPTSLLDVPSSVTVLNGQTLQDAGQQHFEDVLGLIPNLNWAAGTSRPRYFQIRGIGELEQYEGAPNPSVGFLIDDIDFSGLGMPATLFDVKEIEVLRGPQGTRYGANALAGLIAVNGNDPEQSAHYSAAATLGDYGTRSLGATATAPITALDSAWRLSVQRYRSDGFIKNAYLGSNDTNDRDELTARFKWHWQASDTASLDFTLLHANLNDGYDAWTIDNSTTSLSDHPGKDAQRSTGLALKWNNKVADDISLSVTATAADTAGLNSYDGDWGNTQSWRNYMQAWSAANGYAGNEWQSFVYDYTYRADRTRRTRSLDIRLASNNNNDQLNWLIGAYSLNVREHLRELSQGVYDDTVTLYSTASDDFLDSRYDATNLALFGELDGRLAKRWSWSVGLRGERRDANYHDYRTAIADPEPTVAEKPHNTMWGGHVSLSYDLSDAANLYAVVSRGYKAGGFNLGSAHPIQPSFKPESLLNYEIGAKSYAWQNRVYVDVALFYEQRSDMQIRDGIQTDPIGNPDSYTFFTTNARGGYNAGLESSARVQIARDIELGGSLGLLRSREIVELDGVALPAREQAHAPEYTASINATWRNANGWMARVDLSAIDNFYFDVPPNNSQSHAYSLTNVKLGYEQQRWQAYAWVRNLFDKRYAVRGFYFGDEPPDFPNKLYIQQGDPRQVGMSASWNF